MRGKVKLSTMNIETRDVQNETGNMEKHELGQTSLTQETEGAREGHKGTLH